ncbi:MAG TPA: recombinase RecT [Planctomycetota bacterium]|nr:recombinase RecT [Planctomycetota bacterium]
MSELQQQAAAVRLSDGNPKVHQSQQLSKIEDALDKSVASRIEVSETAGGLSIVNYGQVMEFAKMMSLGQEAVPEHCRGKPGVCLAIVTQAIEWRMSPFAVANKSYVVNSRLGYESQLIHAVIETRAPLVGRLRCEYLDEGMQRRCKVIGYLKGEQDPFIFISEPLAKLMPAKNERGERKGSPLWEKKPDLQLWYNASRDWARMYCPDVLLGVYSRDELEEAGPGTLIDEEQPSPKLMDRLPGRMGQAGFSEDAVTNGMADPQAVFVEAAQDAPMVIDATADEPKPAPAEDRPAQEAPKDVERVPKAMREPEQVQEPAPAKDEPPANAAPSAKEVRQATAADPGGIPQTVEEWRAYASTWIRNAENPKAAQARWKGELALRNKLNIDEDDRMQFKALLDERCQQLEGRAS